MTFQTAALGEAVVALCRWPTIGSEPVDQRLTGGLGQRWGPLTFGLQVDRESHRTGGARRATADGTSIAAPAASSTLISQGSIGLALYSILPHPAVLPNRLATCTAARQTANGTFHWLIPDASSVRISCRQTGTYLRARNGRKKRGPQTQPPTSKMAAVDGIFPRLPKSNVRSKSDGRTTSTSAINTSEKGSCGE